MLIEGRISPQNETRFRQLVAYSQGESVRGPDDQYHWIEYDRIAPPLLIDVADGQVRVDGGYNLDDATRSYSTKLYNYQGFDRNDQVVIIGRMYKKRMINNV